MVPCKPAHVAIFTLTLIGFLQVKAHCLTYRWFDELIDAKTLSPRIQELNQVLKKSLDTKESIKDHYRLGLV